MSQAKATFLLPLQDNDGRSLRQEIKMVRTEMFNRFFGWTREGMVRGAYRMETGEMALDASARYFVIVDESRLTQVEEVLLLFKAMASQQKGSTMDPKIVEQIEKIIALENVTPEGFSRILFGFGGLFYQLAPTEAERRVVSQTDLFMRANSRLTELEERELAIMRAQRAAALALVNGSPQSQPNPAPGNAPAQAGN